MSEIKSVKKAMDILTILSASAEEPITLHELAEKTGLNKSTCSHIIDTMCESFYVERVSRKEGYRLGPWAYMLSRFGGYQNTLTKTSVPIMRWLRSKTEATVFLSVSCNGRKYITYYIDPERLMIGMDDLQPVSEGTIFQGYMESTATGLLLMAYMSAEMLERVLSWSGKGPRPSPELSEKLKKIRADGFAHMSVEIQHTQSYGFRVTKGSRTIAAIGVLYPDRLDTPEYRANIIKAGHAAAVELSRRISFQ